MSAKDQKNLLDKLAEVHLATHAILEEADLEMPVHKDSGWRVRDILWHVATWNLEVAKSVNAYQAGEEYLIPDLDEEEIDFNGKAVEEQKKLSDQQILDEWKKAYKELSNAVQEMPVERFPGDMMYPWGDERGDIVTVVEYMIDHEIEHQEEIMEAMQA